MGNDNSSASCSDNSVACQAEKQCIANVQACQSKESWTKAVDFATAGMSDGGSGSAAMWQVATDNANGAYNTCPSVQTCRSGHRPYSKKD